MKTYLWLFTTIRKPNDALREYVMTEQDLARFAKRMDQQIAREYESGTVKRYSGDVEADLAD